MTDVIINPYVFWSNEFLIEYISEVRVVTIARLRIFYAVTQFFVQETPAAFIHTTVVTNRRFDPSGLLYRVSFGKKMSE